MNIDRIALKAVAATSVWLVSSAAFAIPVVLDFEGVGDLAAVDDFYNGGTDSAGNSGTNYGIQFSANSLGVVDIDAGGSGNVANEPSASTILFWLDNSSAIMNVAAGFDTGFSLLYSSATAASINIWDALNATGNLLATIDLTSQYNVGCTGDPNGAYCNWSAIGASFAGTAMSVDFGGTANFTGYDDVTFGSATPGDTDGGNGGGPTQVPEPGSLALLGLGLIALGTARRKKALASATSA